MTQKCSEHSGFKEAISHLKESDSDQWSEINTMKLRIDGIMIRLNVILGVISTAVILLALNLIIVGLLE